MTSEPPATDSVQGRARQLGGEVRRLRLAAGLTQQALADRIGYDRSYLSQVETGAQILQSSSFFFASESCPPAVICSVCSAAYWRNGKPAGRKRMPSDGAQGLVVAWRSSASPPSSYPRTPSAGLLCQLATHPIATWNVARSSACSALAPVPCWPRRWA